MSEKKVKPRFNIIDVLIIVLLAAVIWVFAMYADIGGADKATAGEPSTVQYTVEVKEIREENVDAYAAGDEIIGEKGNPIGTILSVGEYTNDTTLAENKRTGEYVFSEIPNKYTVKLVIESPCTKNESGITVDEMYSIKVGKKINIKTDKYVTSSTILEVKEG